jgi:hypothetical protein
MGVLARLEEHVGCLGVYDDTARVIGIETLG